MNKTTIAIHAVVILCIVGSIALMILEVTKTMEAFEVACHQRGGNITVVGEVFKCELENGTLVDYGDLV